MLENDSQTSFLVSARDEIASFLGTAICSETSIVYFLRAHTRTDFQVLKCITFMTQIYPAYSDSNGIPDRLENVLLVRMIV